MGIASLRAGPSASLRRAAAGAILALASTLLGCAYVSFSQEMGKALTRGYITGETLSVDGPGGPTLVLLFALRDLEPVLIDYNVQLEPGPFSFSVQPGRYAIAAFEDLDRDYQRQPGEPLGYLGLREPLEVSPMQHVRRFDVAMRSDEETHGGRPLDLRDRNENPNLPAFRRNVGVIGTLDDARFSSETGKAAFLKPEAFIESGAVGVFFLEPYDPSRIPVLFVHGIHGSPQDLRPLMEAVDRQRFQVWFAAFPTNFRLDSLARFLELSVRDLGITYDLRRLYLVAHSMGGLISRGFVNLNVAEKKRELIRVFITLSTPFGGHEDARFTQSAPEAALPDWVGDVSWIDLVPNSAFQRNLFASPLPDYVEHHLFFGFLPEEPGDGVVTIQSQLDPRAVEGARGRLHPSLASHTGIVSEPQVQRTFLDILDAAWERDREALRPGRYAGQTAVSLADASSFHFEWAESDDDIQARRAAFEQRVATGVKELQHALDDPIVRSAVRSANLDLALRDPNLVLERDQRWQEGEPGVQVDAYTDPGCNEHLERFVAAHPHIAEVIVTGRVGTNVCQSNPTTDYLQADEGWWQRTWQGRKVWHDDLHFDESADAFGVSIHVPLTDLAEGDTPARRIGVVKALIREGS